MAYIKYFTYCMNVDRNIIPDSGESINANGVVSVLTPEFIPGMFSFSTVFTLYGANVRETNTIRIVFKDSTGKELVNTGDVVLPPNTKKDTMELPSEYVGYNMSMDFRNVVLEAEGEYCTDVYVNGDLVFDAPIYARAKRGTGR